MLHMKKILSTLIIILLLLGISQIAYADNEIQWTDFSNAKIEFKKHENLNIYDLNLSNVNLKSDNYYYYAIQNSSEIVDVNDNTKWSFFDKDKMSSSDSNITLKLQLNGDIYVSFKETTNGQSKVVLQSKKVKRPDLENIGQRINFSFSEVITGINWNTYNDGSNKNNRKVNIKVGSVNDNTILQNIKNGKSNSLENLLNYAKQQTSYVYTKIISANDSKSIVSEMNLKDKQYYFVYAVFDDENGKYYPIEDVSLYQASVGSTGKMLYNYLDSNFTWNISENSKFSDFSQMKLSKVLINNTKQEIAFSNISSNDSVKRKIYYYLSSSKNAALPEITSEKWMAAKSFKKGSNGDYTLDLDITKLPYELDVTNGKLYISIYEVISDNEITSTKIDGNYKLVLNSKEVSLENPNNGGTTNETPKKEDTTTSQKTLPKAGKDMAIIGGILLVMVVGLVGVVKYNKFKDVK